MSEQLLTREDIVNLLGERFSNNELAEASVAAIEREAVVMAWDEGYGDCWDYHVSEGAIGRTGNPYRQKDS